MKSYVHVDEGNEMSHMNGDDVNGGDLILHLLLGDIYLPCLDL